MKVQAISNNSPAFCGKAGSKIMLSCLEKISEHGASFSAGISFLAAVGLRPLAISITPKTDKENKEYACANSIASGLMKLLAALAVTLPVENAVKMIDKNPEAFLKKQTIENLKNGAENLISSKNYEFATGFLKQSTGFLSAVPKTLLTVALIPVITDKLFNKKPVEQKIHRNPSQTQKINSVYEPVINNIPVFKGNITGKLAKGTGKLLDLDCMQKFAAKYGKNAGDVARNVSAGTDILLTALSVFRIKKSGKIEEERKNPLVYNSIISTGMCVGFGVLLDKLIKTGTQKSIERFAKCHTGDPKLPKYLAGMNILRPAVIFALIYYGFLPVASTFLSDKIDKFEKKSR